MVALEVVDPSVQPSLDDTFVGQKRILYARPLETEADLIAAAAPPGALEIRYMVTEIADDAFEDVHSRGTCSMCNGDKDYVQEMKRDCEAELAEYDVEWDPTIRL